MNSALETVLLGVIVNVLCITAVKIAPFFRGYYFTPRSPLLQVGVLVGLFSLTMALVLGFSETTDLALDLHIHDPNAKNFEKVSVELSLSILNLRWGSGRIPRNVPPTTKNQLELKDGLPKVWRNISLGTGIPLEQWCCEMRLLTI